MIWILFVQCVNINGTLQLWRSDSSEDNRESVQILPFKLRPQNSTQIPEFASYPEKYCLFDEFLRLLRESSFRVALCVLVLIRLRIREDKFICLWSNSVATFFQVFKKAHLGNCLRGNSCFLGLSKSFLTTIVFADTACCYSLRQKTLGISSVGNLRSCTGCRCGLLPAPELKRKLLLGESLRRLVSQNWWLNFAPYRWR